MSKVEPFPYDKARKSPRQVRRERLDADIEKLKSEADDGEQQSFGQMLFNAFSKRGKDDII